MVLLLKYLVLTVLVFIQTAFTAWLLWLFILAMVSVFARRKRPQPPPEGHHRFAVIIPAHNEEKMVGRTVASIKGVDYPEALFDVFVVADNCEDETIQAAEAAGARCIIREDNQLRGKGYALQAGLTAVRGLGESYDAFIFFDADSLVEPNFLQHMSGALSAGHQVIQGHYRVADPDRTWFTRLTHLAFILKNYFQFPGLNRFGLSMPLRGSGMCLSRDILDRFGWTSTTLTEDLDFSITLLEGGVTIYFDFYAENRQYMPPTPSAARIQRTRWSAGEAQALNNRLILLFFKAAARLNWRVCLQAMYFASPPMSLLLFLNLMLLAFFSVIGTLWWTGNTWLFLTATVTTAGYAGYFLLSLTATGVSPQYLLAVVMIPFYALWRVVIHMISFTPGISRRMSWQKTDRV